MPYRLTKLDLHNAWAVIDICEDTIDVMFASDVDALEHAAHQNYGYPVARYAAVQLTLLPDQKEDKMPAKIVTLQQHRYPGTDADTCSSGARGACAYCGNMF